MTVQKPEITQKPFFFFWRGDEGGWGGMCVPGIHLKWTRWGFFQIPYQATTANLLQETRDFEQAYSSYPSLALLPCW